MQIQPFNPQNLAAAADRIQVPGGAGSGLALAGPQPPTLLQVFGREVWKRKRLLAVWTVITAVVAGLVVTTVAKPVYRAEGRYSYRPLYGAGGPRPIYTPPNIQSAVQILQAEDVFEPVRAKHTPNMTPAEFARNVHIELSRQSEFIDVSFDYPSPAVAAAVANDLMAEGLKYFTDVRVKSTEQAVVRLREDKAQAMRLLEEAKKSYADEFKARKIADPIIEQDRFKTALSNIGSQLRQAKQEKAKLTAELAYYEKKRKNPDDNAIDEQFVTDLNIRLNAINNRMMDEQAIQNARAEVDRLRPWVGQLRQLAIKGTYPAAEYNLEVSKLRAAEGVLKAAEETREQREQVKKQLEEFQAKTRNGKRPAPAILAEISRLEKDLAGLPATIRSLQDDEQKTQADLADLIALTQKLGPKDEEIGFLRRRAQELDSQLAATSGNSLDPHANDLRIHGQAVPPLAAYSTNAPKLGLAIVGASALLFVGYMALFGLPKGSISAPAPVGGGLANGPGPGSGLLPRALVALIPVSPKPKADQAALNGTATNGMAPGSPAPASTEAAAPMQAPPMVPVSNLPPLADPAGDAVPVAVAEPEPVRALAQKIVDEGVHRGGVVLFSPTDEHLRLCPAIGDLGQYFSDRGDRVLVFDTRHAAETPAWVHANGVAETVAGYLNGTADGPTGCFVPTELRGVEYSRVDLASRVSGVLEAHRFRQLIEQMRDRYSVVFLVGPPVNLDEDHPLLASMAEGMVLVTETAANPVEVHAYLDTLCQQVPARLYGTLAVPKSAA